MAPVQLEMMTAVHRRMAEQIGVINTRWLISLRDFANEGADLAQRLWRCDNAVDGIGLCNDWFRGSANRLLTEGLNASKLWMGFYSAALGAPFEVDASRRQGIEVGETAQEKKSAAAA